MADCAVPIQTDQDILAARRQGRALAAQQGFSISEQALIATAISEVARNIVQYADGGEIIVETLHRGTRRGLRMIARDRGPGIADIQKAMQDGFSTGGGLGLGLPGAKRLMDEFVVASTVGKGTEVTMIKWVDWPGD
jgi:serine/threonine-protein kinase RsbT